MRDLARQGIYRIIYDIIKADSIIVRREIDAVKQLCDKYGITPKHRIASMNLSLAEAVKEVQSLTIGQVEELRKDISQLILADETTQREEALLLFAIMKAIDGKCEVVSVPWGEIMMDNSQLLFIEDGYDEAVNEYIEKHYNCGHWKPTECQIAILWDAISNLKHDGYKHLDELKSLYNEGIWDKALFNL